MRAGTVSIVCGMRIGLAPGRGGCLGAPGHTWHTPLAPRASGCSLHGLLAPPPAPQSFTSESCQEHCEHMWSVHTMEYCGALGGGTL